MLLTQTNTNWHRMPARELANAFDAPNGVQRVSTTLLKKHKILPHPREERMTDAYPSTPAANPGDLVVDTTASISKSDTSSPRTLKHASRRIGDLPPTPPTHSRQSSGSHPTTATTTAAVTAPTTANQYDIPATKSKPDIRSVPTTPPNQRSPPTPDVTPPRAIPLALRSRTTDRYPSSRADSFKTAREDQFSSDEDEKSTVRPVLPSTRPPAMAVTQLPERRRRRREVGLGLGLESDNEGAATPRAHADSPLQEFHVFDGEWASESNEVEREWDDNLMRNVTVRKRPGRVLNLFTDGPADEVLEDDIVSPTQATKVVRGLPLQERIAQHRRQREVAAKPSDEKRRERVPCMAGPESPDSFDIRRFSTMSGRSIASTVVEAMVVETTPSRTRTLRHTKKHIGLRDFSSDQSTVSSAPTSVASSEPHPHRLHHPAGRIPEKRHRSLASNTTVTTASSSGKSRRSVLKNGGIPVVVIPDRQSSTKSSKAPSLRSTSSRRTKRSMSLNSAPLSSSSKFNDPGHFDTLPPRKRTMSESAGSRDTVRTIDYPPNIPARRSSLSAPTSRNNSRAGSLTAESLKAHNLLQPKVHREPDLERLRSRLSAESHKDLGTHSPQLNVDHNGDPFFGKRLSAQVTPFSQFSYDTAGTTAEVSEAMAVSIYPHQNKSLLVVQQMASLDNSPRTRGTAPGSQLAPPTMTLNDQAPAPVTPPQPAHPMDEVDSPLRNPRVPPAPPAIKFIPATPSGLTPGAEEEKQLGYTIDFDDRPTTSDNKPMRSMSLMRRAFRNRRNSEPTMLTPGLLKRTFSLSNRRRELVDESTQTSQGTANPSTAYPSVADRPADGSRLHPFWRPSHFWDDLEDEGFADDELVGSYPKIDNRPGPPKRNLSGKLKRTFAILPLQDEYEQPQYASERRTMRKNSSGNLRVVKQRSNSSLSSTDRRAYSVARGQRKSARAGRAIPGLGIRVEYVGWSGLKNRLRERRREQRNQKLRASISHPKAIQSGMDDVLRRRRSPSPSRSRI